MTPVEQYWTNNHPVMAKVEWNTVCAYLPNIAPVMEQVQNKLGTCEGDWTDKAELFASKFRDIIPTAALEATLAITDLQDYSTPIFTFSDIGLIDSNFRTLPPGAGANWPICTQQDVCYFKLTLPADPRRINPSTLEVDPALFPTQTATMVFLRTLRINNAGSTPTNHQACRPTKPENPHHLVSLSRLRFHLGTENTL
jgi:hypothetical protein